MKKEKVKVAVDLGNSMLNSAAYIEKELILKKLPNKLQFEKTISPKARVMKKDGKVIYLGVGDLNNNVLKHTRKNLLEQVLVMIYEIFPDEDNLSVELITGLPPTQMFNEKYLKLFQDIFIQPGEIKITIDGKQKTFEILNVDVKAEGYSGFISLVDKITTKQNILGIDVGGSTTDLCNYEYDYEDDMYYPNVTDTIEKGIIDFETAIANKFNSKNGADIKISQIDVILRNDIDVIEYEGSKYKLDDYIDAMYPIIDDMINKITNKFGQLDGYYVVGIGGGYKTFNKYANQFISKQLEVDDDSRFYANVIGYLEQ
ncbi:TPA: hypothetical protein KRE09_002339 [Clostridioides difficile]|uniref:plasmid segregation protein ParM domain-containing protein n=1 Tax=Clostridioides difficile TaxID=1496 RepID=UPI0005B44D09|nr:plasmid segregation protein ParM domain-containing protein [Clostridioides difficile]AUO78380.1 heat shock protein 70 [Clostridioides phage LIBA6276]MCG3625843.1 plasmid segregation protein ParM [Clostridioides difficile]MDB0488100.1 hypothetical protein [Clostridioides difficile]MDY6558523.1 plasmid segregation protein ParM [Clostridioides difficile]MDY6622136.1 plasmid segregation protein ParM [Clostridioides difficile]